MSTNPLKWREHAAVADMHCRLAAKLLNTMAQTDRPAADYLLQSLGKAEECAKAAQAAVIAARGEVEVLFRRVPSVRGVVAKPAPPAPMGVPVAELVSIHPYCEWRQLEKVGEQGPPGGPRVPLYRWAPACKRQPGYMDEPPERCLCGKRPRVHSVPVPAS